MSETRLTPARRAELARLCKVATRAPWVRPEFSINVLETPLGTVTVQHESHPDDAMDRDVLDAQQADCDFIAAARTALPEALAESVENERLRAEVDRLTARWEALKVGVDDRDRRSKHTGYANILAAMTRLEQEP